HHHNHWGTEEQGGKYLRHQGSVMKDKIKYISEVENMKTKVHTYIQLKNLTNLQRQPFSIFNFGGIANSFQIRLLNFGVPSPDYFSRSIHRDCWLFTTHLFT